MRTHKVAESLRYYTGILIREYEILKWADKGLLGNIERFKIKSETSKNRDFNNVNVERAILIVFLTKILHMPWSIEQLQKYLDTNDKLMNDEICMNLEKLETKGIPRFKHILLERENK